MPSSKRRMPTFCLAGLCAVTFGCGPDAATDATNDRSPLSEPASYQVNVLAGLPPGSAAQAMNDNGQVVVNTTDGLTSHAFLWERGQITNLGSLGGSDTYVWGINASGIVVGESQDAKGVHYPFIWKDGAMTGLIEAGDKPRPGVAYAVNDAGRVVGVLYGPDVATGFVWSAGKFTELPPPAGTDWTDSTAWDINAAGDVSGEILGPAGSAAASWHENQATVLPISDGAVSEAALAIDSHGNAFGRSTDGDLHCRAKVWRNGKTEYLPFEAGVAVAANDAGFVAGQFEATTDERHAFVVRPDRALDLHAATVDNPYQTTVANDVNRFGRVVGAGFLQGNAWKDAEAVIWTPAGATFVLD